MTAARRAPSDGPDDAFSPLRWQGGALELLDQTRLPAVEEWLTCRRPEEVADAIRRLAVRGAPAIGVAAAYGLALAFAPPPPDESPSALERRFEATANLLAATRPTAVNLGWAIERGRGVFRDAGAGARAAGAEAGREAVHGALLAWARDVHSADVAANRAIGEHGAALFAAGSRVLTHCNTGALATAGYGTALGVIQSAWRQGRVDLVWVDETRPLLQGARLTAWELARLGIPHRLLPDSAAGSLLARGEVDRVVVGADRIARNGDTANKIGTYPLAVLAQRHGVPFYVAAPLSTIDSRTPTGAAIPIEERAPDEVTTLAGHPVAPSATPALNLAFDVTPADLITAIITDAGVLHPPYTTSIGEALRSQE
ncbi:MAG TPA: S-methyl-5-thioribose-1-phosphate isomerase [Thermoanaerobaculia bacterium]|nr:S-methyl-5-thioribose-1-phosphate isomerase [Thermoanaerobaculia bacterium]